MLLLIINAMSTIAQEKLLFIGTYTNSGSKGIYVYNFNSETGKANFISYTENVIHPSFLAISKNKKYIYAVNETAGNDAGSVSAFSVNDGKLSLINKQETGGDHPCYLAIDKTGKWLTAGNYSGGNFSIFEINDDGSLSSKSQLIQHEGSSIDKTRQNKAHVHSTVFSPDNKYLFVSDLGIDKIMIYKFDAEDKQPLSTDNPAYETITAGGGPRHFVFHQNHKYVYLVEEMSGQIDMFRWKKGKLSFRQRISTHPAEYNGGIGSADIHISPDGKFLYASNRGDANSIAIFSINKKNGELANVGFQSTAGKTPRNFMIDPTGKFLLVANQNSNNIVLFRRDIKTGLLTATGEEIKIPSPSCVIME